MGIYRNRKVFDKLENYLFDFNEKKYIWEYNPNKMDDLIAYALIISSNDVSELSDYMNDIYDALGYDYDTPFEVVQSDANDFYEESDELENFVEDLFNLM